MTKIAVLTGSDDRSTILECLGAGVHGYILKSSPMEEIERAIATDTGRRCLCCAITDATQLSPGIQGRQPDD